MVEFGKQTGGFDPVRVEKSDPLHIDVLMKERGGPNQARAKMDVKDADPPEVLLMGVRVVNGPGGTRSTPGSASGQ